jgi:2-oxoisovalerate dehydrogenase E1 component
MLSTLPGNGIETYKSDTLNHDAYLKLYRQLLLPRLIEEKMLILLRQGRISKWFSGIGQEAISVGVTAALQPDEFIFTLHRNLGVFTTRDMPLDKLVAQWQGKLDGYSKGRDRSFHFGALEHHIVGMISHLGPQLSLADGVALAHKLKGEAKIAVAFSGEGGTSQGEFHEALNVAAVWALPVLFVIENNGYGLSTPSSDQFLCKHLVDKAIGFGMEGHRIDGNNILEVYNTVKSLSESMRSNPRPILLECDTFRMRGHEEASGTKYVPKDLMEYWATKDPVSNYEQWLMDHSILTKDAIEEERKKLKLHINESVERGFAMTEVSPNAKEELADVFKPFQLQETKPVADTKTMRLVDAIRDGMYEAMQKHDKLILMGQDIAEYGGVFKATEGFVEAFGIGRVRNTPLCESAIIGAALGLSMKGYKSMVEMQFADFVTCGFNQIVNNLAKLHYRWGEHADVVVRMPTGAGVAAGPFHSQSNEAWFTHVPGLKIVYPSNPADAKGLLLTAFEDPNPVMYFEHKALYRSASGEVPTGYYTIPFGQANLVLEGNDVSIITYGMGVHWAREVAQAHHISADVLDLRTLCPIDYNSIEKSVRKTGKVLILHEDTLFGGIGGELAAWIGEHLFEHLDAPIMRVASLDTPVPFNKMLEDQFLPKQRLEIKLNQLLDY